MNTVREIVEKSKELIMKLLKATIVSASVFLLAACGEAYDGTYTSVGKDKVTIELSGDSVEWTLMHKGEERSVDGTISDYKADEEGNPQTLKMTMEVNGRERKREIEFINDDFFAMEGSLFSKEGADKFSALTQYKGTYINETEHRKSVIKILDNRLEIIETTARTGRVTEKSVEFDGLVLANSTESLTRGVGENNRVLLLLSDKTSLSYEIPALVVNKDNNIEIKDLVFIRQSEESA